MERGVTTKDMKSEHAMLAAKIFMNVDEGRQKM